ncbi:transmembrane protein 69-like [Rana temporaria]|uniref:transmembrane protein 69-like n=1 Tax=Rana temporaria TaxID=8407 RepID=UPI001AADE98E|nr:transmembrane protein 69-like [Rana temporaria]
MLLFLRGGTLPLAMRLLKDSSPLCRRWLFSPAAVGLHQRPPIFRPAPMVPLSASRLHLHTSSQWQKRKREVEEGILIPTAKRHWQEIKKIPKPAFILGVLGATPFMAVPITMCVMQAYLPELALVQVLYGACILSFLGGVRWGYTLPDNSPARPSWINLVTGAVFPYMAFNSLLLMADFRAATLGVGMGFAISLAVDIFGIRDMDLSPIAPLWYKWLRILLTSIVLASLIAALGCSGRYPEVTTGNQKAPKKLLRTPW